MMLRIYRATLTLVLVLGGLRAATAAEAGGAPAPMPWQLDEVRRELALNPGDPYLQYVALQLARREKSNDVLEEIDRTVTGRWGARTSRGRRDQVDVFSIFSGALAVQESL